MRCQELIPHSSPGSAAELPPAGPGPASPSPVETFPVGSLGPGPGCKELVAGYLQFIISPVIASRSAVAAGQSYKYKRGWGQDLPEGCAGAPVLGWCCWLAALRRRAARGVAPQARTAALAGADLPGVPRAAVAASPRGRHVAGERRLLLPVSAAGTAAPTARLPTCAGSLAASLGWCFSETNSRSSQPC